MLLDRIAKGELTTAHLAPHTMPRDAAVDGYDMFRAKSDGCVRAVFTGPRWPTDHLEHEALVCARCRRSR
ncbi:hypothetical protein ACQI4E_26160 [Streptomyces sp. CA-252508]|uniref:hypothetical protein n=1 Tax=Streptomyces sp. CA-252508 TaxID=3418946 RepID=UPI003D94C73C